MKPIVFIDPQSYLNLAIYDYSLLSQLEGDIHYICSKLYDYKPLPSNIKQHKLFRYNNMNSNLRKAISYTCSYAVILLLLLRIRPKVIHLQWLRIPAFDTRIMAFAKWITGCKIIFTAHNILPHDTGLRHFAAYQRFYRKVDTIIVHSYSTKQDLVNQFGIEETKIAVIDHGVLPQPCNLALLKEKEDEFANHYQLEGKMVFSSLGYQYYYKGVDILAEVWATTPELCNSDRCKLLLVGKNKGVDFSVVDNISNVIVEDRLTSDEEFHYLMTHTDISVLPYRTISQSGLLLTTISMGIPFLITDIGGLAESLNIAPVGWKIHSLSADALRKQLLWFLDHPEAVAKVKEDRDSWNKIQKHYSWERIGKLTQQVYNKS